MCNLEEILEYELIDIEFEQPYEQAGFAREDIPVIEYDEDGIPMGNSPEEIEMRRNMIHEHIQQWRADHKDDPRIFNEDLNDYIRINQLFLFESVHHAVENYLSTKAVLRMEEIMAKAKYIGDSKKKEDNNNQKSFEKMLILLFKSEEHGNAKMTIGIKRRTQEKIEYSITVPTPHTPFIADDMKPSASKNFVSPLLAYCSLSLGWLLDGC